MLKSIVFVVVSAGILYVSWPSLNRPRSHGFPRFFAFESLLVLILLNVGRWFDDPFSPLQLLSWLLLMASLVLAIHGFYLLRVVGRPKQGIESTTVLAMQGAYKYVRHPLYGSLLLLGCGTFLKDPSLPGAVLILTALASLVVTARVEESENLRKFGADYAAYVKASRMFLPFLF